MCKGPVAKLIIGLLLIAAGIYAILPPFLLPGKVEILGVEAGFAWDEFATVMLGAIPVMVILLGLLMVWIEIEEIKIERAEKALEEKEKEERKRKQRKRKR